MLSLSTLNDAPSSLEATPTQFSASAWLANRAVSIVAPISVRITHTPHSVVRRPASAGHSTQAVAITKVHRVNSYFAFTDGLTRNRWLRCQLEPKQLARASGAD